MSDTEDEDDLHPTWVAFRFDGPRPKGNRERVPAQVDQSTRSAPPRDQKREERRDRASAKLTPVAVDNQGIVE